MQFTGVTTVCMKCGAKWENRLFLRCPRCGAPTYLELASPTWRLNKEEPNIWRYSSLLPRFKKKVTMGEGYTPLRRYAPRIYLKLENRNPTGSYSDRASAVIASYYASLEETNKKIVLEYLEDFSLSLTYYLKDNLRVEVIVTDPDKVDPIEIVSLSKLGARIIFEKKLPRDTLHYANPLAIEGLKTIAFEIIEKSPPIDTIVVPAETGLLAYSVSKGFYEAKRAGINIEYEVVAVLVGSSREPEILRYAETKIKVANVASEEVIKSLIDLSRQGLWVKPLSAAALAEATNRGNAIAIITSSSGHPLLIPPEKSRKSPVKTDVIEVLKTLNEATAYEIWEYLGRYTLRGVYKALQSLEKEGIVCSKYRMQRNRRIKIYYPCTLLQR